LLKHRNPALVPFRLPAEQASPRGVSFVRETARRHPAGAATIEEAYDMPKPKSEDEELDEALEDSFPASDPPAQSQPTKKIGKSDAKRDTGDDED